MFFFYIDFANSDAINYLPTKCKHKQPFPISNQEHQERGLDASRLSNSFYKRIGAVHTNDKYHVNI